MDHSETPNGGHEQPSWMWLGLGAIVLAVGISIFMLSTAAGASSRSDDGGAVSESEPLVEVALIQPANAQYEVSAPGRLQPRQTIEIVGEVPGKVTYLNSALEVGGRLSADDILFRIDPADYQASLRQAEAALASAEASLAQAIADKARQAELADRGFSPDSVLDTAVATLASAQASVDQAKAQLALARQNLARTTVRAPFPAIVLSETLAPDSYIAPGTPVARLLDASAGEIVAGLSPEDVGAVRRALLSKQDAGEALTVFARPNEGSLGNIYLKGTLESFSPEVDPTSRTVAVRAVFPSAFAPENEGLVFAGDFMTLEIEGIADQTLYTVPSAAVRRNAAVWAILPDEHLRTIAVTPIDIGPETTLVMSAESLAGQRVMITSLPEEVEGMRVRIAELTAQQSQD